MAFFDGFMPLDFTLALLSIHLVESKGFFFSLKWGATWLTLSPLDPKIQHCNLPPLKLCFSVVQELKRRGTWDRAPSIYDGTRMLSKSSSGKIQNPVLSALKYPNIPRSLSKLCNKSPNQWYCFLLFLPSLVFWGFSDNPCVSFTNIGHFEQSETSLRFASGIHSVITTQLLLGSNSHWHFQGNMAAEEPQWLRVVEQVGNTILLYKPGKITPGILPLLPFYQKEADNVERVLREQHKMIKGLEGSSWACKEAWKLNMYSLCKQYQRRGHDDIKYKYQQGGGESFELVEGIRARTEVKVRKERCACS